MQMAVSTDFTCYTRLHMPPICVYTGLQLMTCYEVSGRLQESHFETKWPLGWNDWQCASDRPVSNKRHSPASSLTRDLSAKSSSHSNFRRYKNTNIKIFLTLPLYFRVLKLSFKWHLRIQVNHFHKIKLFYLPVTPLNILVAKTLRQNPLLSL